MLYLPENMAPCRGDYTAEMLQHALETGATLTAPCTLCSEKHDLIVSLGCTEGIIPREEAAIGIREGTVRDIAILSCVGLPVSFRVMDIPENGPVLLSRRAAQEQALSELLAMEPGDIVPAVVTNLTAFGAFCDVGCGVPALMGMENISVSRISHAADRFQPGQPIYAVIRAIDHARRRIFLSHRELLGTWAENAAAFSQGQTVTGIVRSCMDYGVFVELTPNLSGLAESDLPLAPGDAVSVYIKSIIPETLKIKLVVLKKLPSPPAPKPLHYYFTGRHIAAWRYGSEQVPKCVTVF